MNVLSCGPKVSNIAVITDVISPSQHTQKSTQHVRACVSGDGAICSKNRKIVPYHGDSLNSRISVRLRSPSPIKSLMCPFFARHFTIQKNFSSHFFVWRGGGGECLGYALVADEIIILPSPPPFEEYLLTQRYSFSIKKIFSGTFAVCA